MPTRWRPYSPERELLLPTSLFMFPAHRTIREFRQLHCQTARATVPV